MKKEKYINLVFFIIIFIIILLTTLARPLDDLDEIWNYNIARNIANGLIPYKDISMITSPLLAMITAIFLKVFSNELIITRILSSILATLILYSLYKTMSILKINNNVKYLVVVILLLILRKFFCLDYNWLVALIGIIILNLELKNVQKKDNNSLNFKYEFLIGCLAGIAICIKQSIGGIIAIVCIIYNLIFIDNKNTFKRYIKTTLIRICGIILPVLILFIYLYINDALYYFIDYCILGIKTFSNSISYIELLRSKNIFLRAFSILIPVMYLIVGIKIIFDLSKGKDIKLIFTMLVYSVALFTITFPISNDIHFLIGTLPSMILFLYLIYSIIKKYIKINFNKLLEFAKITTYVFLFVLLVYALSECYAISKENIICKDLNHFKYIPISEYLYNSIKEMDEYILDKNCKVYVLDSNACIYMIPIDRYNKDYDMFNLGNFGSRGEEGKIEDLKKEDNVIILLRNNAYSRNWQHPENVRKYIEANWNLIDIVQVYDVYEKGE